MLYHNDCVDPRRGLPLHVDIEYEQGYRMLAMHPSLRRPGQALRRLSTSLTILVGENIGHSGVFQSDSFGRSDFPAVFLLDSKRSGVDSQRQRYIHNLALHDIQALMFARLRDTSQYTSL